MRRWTTPCYRLLVNGADLAGCKVYATFSQGRMRSVTVDVTDSAERLGNGEWAFTARLTQAQTARFIAGMPIFAQVNVMDANGYRACTGEAKLDGLRNLLDRRL